MNVKMPRIMGSVVLKRLLLALLIICTVTIFTISSFSEKSIRPQHQLASRSFLLQVYESLFIDNVEEEKVSSAQKLRQKILQEGCRTAHRLPTKHNTVDYLIEHRKELLKHIMVNDEHKLLYCFVPKVSCTQWKKVFGVLAGTLPTNISIEDINSADAHQMRRHKLLAHMPPRKVRERLQTYRAFLFVRHPFERLVSAFRNKFEAVEPWTHFPSLYSESIRRSYSNKTGVPATNTSELTFTQFASWLADRRITGDPAEWQKPSRGVHNEHWEPVFSMCHPCLLNYSLIGHQDTLLADARHVLRVANVTRTHFPEGYHRETGVGHNTTAKTAQYFASLPKDDVKQLIQFYYQDFVIFGYKPASIFSDFNDTAYNIVQAMHENLRMDQVYKGQIEERKF